MKKIAKLMLLPLLVLTSACSTGNSSNETSDSFVVTDMMNRSVKIKNNPTKFVCLGPGALRQYCYVADTSKIVGIESYEQNESGWGARPYIYSVPNVKDLPVIGQGGKSPNANAEALLALKADVIFTSYRYENDGKTKKEADNLSYVTNTPVVVIGYNPNGLFAEDIYQSFELIGKVTNKEQRAHDVVKYFKDAKDELEAKASVQPFEGTAYVGAINRKGEQGINFTCGDYLIFDVLKVRNAAASIGSGYKTIHKEAISATNPDFIFIDAANVDRVKKDLVGTESYFLSLKAFVDNNVYVQLPFTFYSNNLEVALANAYFTGSCIYPEQFKDLDMKTKFNEITSYLLNVKVYDKMVEKFHQDYGHFVL